MFNTIEVMGHMSKNPFENHRNDVPMTAICRSIEIDLRKLLLKTGLSLRIEPLNDVLF